MPSYESHSTRIFVFVILLISCACGWGTVLIIILLLLSHNLRVIRIILVKISQAKYVPLAAKYNRHGMVNSST